jgi:hypothetical protein
MKNKKNFQKQHHRDDGTMQNQNTNTHDNTNTNVNMQQRKSEKSNVLYAIKKTFTKLNPVLVGGIVALVFVVVFVFVKQGKQNPAHGENNPQGFSLQYPNASLSQEEIALDAIESYLYIAALQAFQIAQTTGVDSKEYREYEQKYIDYRTFRDNRMKNALERSLR